MAFYNRVEVLVDEGRVTDVIYPSCTKHLIPSHTTFLSVRWRNMDSVVAKELAGCSHAKSCSQCLNIQVDTKDKWQLVFVWGKYWDWLCFTVTNMDNGKNSTFSKSADTD